MPPRRERLHPKRTEIDDKRRDQRRLLDSLPITQAKYGTTPEWDLQGQLEAEIIRRGGFVNTHAHADRFATIDMQTLLLANSQLQEKWHLVDELKRKSSIEDIEKRMSEYAELMIAQGVTVLCTFVDVDAVIEDRALKAAFNVREKYKDKLQIILANQTLKGVIDPEARAWFDYGAQYMDILGGLPKKDSPNEDEHLDIILKTAKKYGKMVHVHVDQLNTTQEKEMEKLAEKTIEHGMQGGVVAVHGVSVAAHSDEYQDELLDKMIEAEIMVIVCPIAWIDHRSTPELARTHNSMFPAEKYIAKGGVVAIGTDNTADIYKPLANGRMMTDLQLFAEVTRIHDMETLIKVATENGRRVLGLPYQPEVPAKAA